MNRLSLIPFEAWRSFRRRYARATDYLAKIYKTSENAIFFSVRADRRRFERLKFIVKLLHISTLFDDSIDSRDVESGRAFTVRMLAVWEGEKRAYCPTLTRIYALYLTNVKDFWALGEPNEEKRREIWRKIVDTEPK